MEKENDLSLKKIRENLNVEKEEDYTKPCFKLRDGVLIRLSRPITQCTDTLNLVTQIVVPRVYRDKILEVGHNNILSGHFGVDKTCRRIRKNFYWPGMKKDIKRFVKSCHQCQLVGNPNRKIPKAPLYPIPVVKEPFQEVLIDIVGPLPKTKSGFIYLLTIMDRTSRFPEAIPLRSMKADKVVKVLIEYFTRYGLPEVVQSDCGTNFTSKLFKDKMKELGVRHVTSSPYHPESQGAIERFHQTLKTMLKKYCEEETEWDRDMPYLLFAIRSIPNDSLGLSPFDIVFGHNVRGPLDVIRDHWEGESPGINLLDFISNSKEKLAQKWNFAREHLKIKQDEMKKKYDVHVKLRDIKEGDNVLAFLPVPGKPFKASFSGPWRVSKKISDVNFLIETPTRRRKHQVCHINMLKKYESRENTQPIACMKKLENEDSVDLDQEWPKSNSVALKRLDQMLSHIDEQKRSDITNLIGEFEVLFKDTPGRTDILVHDVDVGEAKPIKQYPYRMNPEKAAIVDKEKF